MLAIIPATALVRQLPFSALAIGSMVPDLPLFLPFADYAQTHSNIGVFTACLPLGMLSFILFQAMLKAPLMALLPVSIQTRLSKYSRPLLLPSVGFFLSVTVSILIGAYTHIIWDAFTHKGRWGVHLMPLLERTLTLAGESLPIYKIHQYGSTIIGLPLLVILAAVKLNRSAPISPDGIVRLSSNMKWGAIGILLLIPLLVTILVLRLDATTYAKVGMTIKWSGSILIIVLIIYAAVFHAVMSERTPTERVR
jgi:hypothetical protein